MASDLDTFMATMVASSPPVSVARAVALAREHYGLEARAERLTGERDENFRMTAADGAQYVLKIANAAEDPLVTGLPIAALRHVENTDAALPCPRVVPARNGSAPVRFRDDAGVERVAYLLTYLRGTPLAATRRSRRQRAACGRVGGRLSCALRGFAHPAAERMLIWDVRHAAQLTRLLAEVPDFPCRQSADEVLARVVPDLETLLPRLRQQVVHNDLNPRNILVDPTDEACVTGVIDFGDLSHTALIADVAVAAADLMPEDCAADVRYARASIRDIAIAYHESVPLLEEELAVLGTLVAARLVANLVVPAWHVRKNPGGGHFVALEADFVRARLEIARGLLLEDISL
jgi:Ser/Thr protein kinase RdoA (MazF antagonist)